MPINTPTTNELLLLGAAWLLYFAVHSGLAALRFKHVVAARWPALIPAYRARVPPLIPLPWRYLSRNDATRLLSGQKRTQAIGPEGASTPGWAVARMLELIENVSSIPRGRNLQLKMIADPRILRDRPGIVLQS